MKHQAQITFRNLDTSEAVKQQIQGRLGELDQLCDSIIAGSVVVDMASHRHSQGRHFQVSIHLELPGSEIVVTRDPAGDQAHEDINVAVRDAFDVARRQLEQYVRRNRGETKAHSMRGMASGKG